MGVYQDKTYVNGLYPKPKHEIDPKQKNGAWVADNIKYYYNQYIAGNTAFTPEDAIRLAEYRLYLAGKQPTGRYRDLLTYDTVKGDHQLAVDQRKAYHNINYDNLMSPMPKYIRKIEGMFLKQDHMILASAVNEKARADKQQKLAEKYVAIELADIKKKINALMGVPELAEQAKAWVERDTEEVSMLQNTAEYKLPYEIASEKVVETTINLSKYKHIKRKIIRDLVCGSIAGMREVIQDNKIIWRYLDPINVIAPYSENEHFNDMEYFCEQEYWKIRDLRKVEMFDAKGNYVNSNEEELRKLAKTFHKYNHGDKAFNLYDKYYAETDSYGYDEYTIPVLYGAFKSVDTKYEYTFKVAGETRIADGTWGVVKENTRVSSEDKIYHGYWIVSTDYHFDCNILNNMSRNEAGKVTLPAHIVKLDGTSIIENAIPILDQYALLSYRFQNAWASAVPSSYAYDVSAMENITKNSGGKLTFFDIIRLHQHGQGLPYRSKPIDSDINYQMSKGIERIEGGLGWTQLQEFLATEEKLDKQLISVTGIPNIETAGERTSPSVARMAIAAMSDVLKPLYDCQMECKEKISYNTVYRLQIMLKHSKKAAEFYTNILGKHYVEWLKMAYTTEPMSIGVSFEAMATEEMKSFILQAAQQALAGGKNGTPLLKMSEYLYLVDNINTASGLKTFRMLLAHREIVDDQQAQARAEKNIELQNQAIQQQIQAKGQVAFAESMGKAGLELYKTKAEKDLELRNDAYSQGNQLLANMTQQQFDNMMAMYMQSQGQGQPQSGQPQPPQPPMPQQQTQ